MEQMNGKEQSTWRCTTKAMRICHSSFKSVNRVEEENHFNTPEEDTLDIISIQPGPQEAEGRCVDEISIRNNVQLEVTTMSGRKPEDIINSHNRNHVSCPIGWFNEQQCPARMMKSSKDQSINQSISQFVGALLAETFTKAPPTSSRCDRTELSSILDGTVRDWFY